ncbi:phage head-tail connector protein [uncultured Parvimonas sp.]|uniref:phage head-tail connector protein n=1 Tax=uncultured Parvimonas sp. TaxID=747372 RepID=UPI00259538A6|nr:hypothetical protein [uncultured Parvimonas sp.]
MLDKDKIIKELNERPGMEKISECLYQDAIDDIMTFTHLKKEEVEKIEAMGSIVKDLIAFRFNTLGVEGISSENQAGVNTSYIDDIPKRIKVRLRAYRRLNYER